MNNDNDRQTSKIEMGISRQYNCHNSKNAENNWRTWITIIKNPCNYILIYKLHKYFEKYWSHNTRNHKKLSSFPYPFLYVILAVQFHRIGRYLLNYYRNQIATKNVGIFHYTKTQMSRIPPPPTCTKSKSFTCLMENLNSSYGLLLDSGLSHKNQ